MDELRVEAEPQAGGRPRNRPRNRLDTIQESRSDPTRGWEAVCGDAARGTRALRPGGGRGGHGDRGQGGSPPASHRGRRAAQGESHRGVLTMKATPDHSDSMRVRALMEHGVLTLSIARASRDRSGDDSQDVVATVPVEDLAVGVQRGRIDMFVIATHYRGKLYDDICCFTDTEETRNKWLSTFRRLGVQIVDERRLNDEAAHAAGRPLVTSDATLERQRR